jgi:parallel beta-helix repeat protein
MPSLFSAQRFSQSCLSLSLAALFGMPVAASPTDGLPLIPSVGCSTSSNALNQWRQTYQTAHRIQQLQIRQSIIVPSNAIPIAPGTNIQAIVDRAAPGAVFLLRAGTHRLRSVQPKSGMQFYGEVINNQLQTTLNGAQLLTKFTGSNGLYTTNVTPTGQTSGQMVNGYERGGYSQDLFINQVPLRHVSRKAEVGTGKWFFDYAANTLYMGDNPAGKTVELSTSRLAFSPSASGITIAGLIVEKYANPAQSAAIGGTREAGLGIASDWQVRGNEVRLNHGVGIRVQDRGQAIGNYIWQNGQLGIAANGNTIRLTFNEITANNFAKFNPGWESGGSKFAYTNGLTVRSNLVYNNDGPGLWTDIDNQNTEYADNVVHSNTNMGIFHEISYAATIHDNYVANNGRDNTAWLYGTNILISTSRDVNVYNNVVEVNPNYGNGIGVIWQNRGAQYSAERNQVHDNAVRYFGNAGRSGAATDTPPGQASIFKSNRSDANRYYIPSSAIGYRYEWANKQIRFAPLQALGQEASGQENLCS